VLRTDLVDPQLSGNKWFKLLPNLALAREQGRTTLLSFGGPWSNHLHALACAGKRYGFATHGIIRGDADQPLTPCLLDMQAQGMTLQFVSRHAYREFRSPERRAGLQQEFGNCHVIPEGGCNRPGVLGCQQILPRDLSADVSHIMVACGTGTTMTGLITSTGLPVYGVQALKADGYVHAEVTRQLQEFKLDALSSDWRIYDQYHGGGFARATPALCQLIREFEHQTGIALEPVYSGKLVLGLQDLLERKQFAPGSHILLVHGGGLQGRRGFSLLMQD